MTATLPLLLSLIVAGTGFTTVYSLSDKNQKIAILSTEATDAVEIASSGFNLVKNSIIKDTNFHDHQGLDKYSNTASNNNYYNMYSSALDEKISDLPLNDGKLSVLVYPDGDDVKVISKGEKNGKIVYLGAVFSLLSNANQLPVAYAGTSSNVSGGSMCSYYYDGTEVVGKTQPNLSMYLDGNFWWSPDFEVPNNPVGPVEKDVKLYTAGSVNVSGYKTIDQIYSNGDVVLKNRATVDYVYANGDVKTYSGASYNDAVKYGSYDHPDLNPDLTDNVITPPGGVEVQCGNSSGCTKDTSSCDQYSNNPYNNGSKKTAWANGYANSSLDCLSVYGTSTTSSNPYMSWSKQGKAWQWGYDNDASDSQCNNRYWKNQSRKWNYKGYRDECKAGSLAFDSDGGTKTSNSDVVACTEGQNSKNDYDTCLNGLPTPVCYSGSPIDLPAGDYGTLTITGNCELNLIGDDYTFTSINVTGTGDINYNSESTIVETDNVTMTGNGSINYNNTNPNDYMVLSAENVSLSGHAEIVCDNPQTCLLDTNDLTIGNANLIQGTTMVRDTADLKGGEVIGNLIASNLEASNTTMCNIVDANGGQVMSSSFYDVLTEGATGLSVVTKMVQQILCKDIDDCVAKLN